MSHFLAFKKPAVRPEQGEAEDGSLLSFATEAELDADRAKALSPPAAKGGQNVVYQRALAGLLFLAIFALGVLSAVYLRRAPIKPVASADPFSNQGTAVVLSEPSGANVTVDGVARGTTPFELPLDAGEHTIELRLGSISRTLSISVRGGERSTQYVELGAAAVPARGRLEITSEPAGARVSVDGVARGVTPLSVTDLEPGRHRVVVSNAATTIERNLTTEAGSTATLAVSLVAQSHAAGWVAFKAPFEMQVVDRGEVVGTTGADRLMLAAGKREVRLASAAFGFATTVSIDVQPGRVASVAVSVPNGSLSINALPWAEVFLDGRPVGTTPLANLSVPVGPHEVVWRHPQLGERRQTIAVTGLAPVRAGVDFAK